MPGEAPKSFVPHAFFSRRNVRVVFSCESSKLDECLFCSSYFQLRFHCFSQSATLNTCRHVSKRTLLSRLELDLIALQYCKLNMAGRQPLFLSQRAQCKSGVVRCVCVCVCVSTQSPDTTHNAELGTRKERSAHHARSRATARETVLQRALASGHKTERSKRDESKCCPHRSVRTLRQS